MRSYRLLAAAAAVAFTAAVGTPAEAGAILDAIKQRGSFKCGTAQPTPGWGFTDSAGTWQGFNIDVCRGISAALFGDAGKAQFVVVTSQSRFPALQSGEVDVLSNNTTWTLARDTQLGFNFAPTIFYDGQGFLIPKKLGISSALKLDGATVCVLPGTTTELNLADYFRANRMSFKPVVIENTDEIRRAYFDGRCDVMTNDRSALAAIRTIAPNPADHVVLPDVISKEPLAPVVKHGDDQWFDIVKWTVYALMEAEEFGITKDNVDKMAAESKDPRIQRLLGVTPGMGAAIGLDEKWAVNIIKAIGNYGEIYDRHLGPKTPLQLERGVNDLWTRGGLMYAPPVR
jgi:general L-amino acid transport system substrate-binding protein